MTRSEQQTLDDFREATTERPAPGDGYAQWSEMQLRWARMSPTERRVWLAIGSELAGIRGDGRLAWSLICRVGDEENFRHGVSDG